MKFLFEQYDFHYIIEVIIVILSSKSTKQVFRYYTIFTVLFSMHKKGERLRIKINEY